MTSLGGDYYDFLEIDAEHFGVIIGDVSGHGISAALIMAMAKAGVKMAGIEEQKNPSRLLSSVHEIIYSLKNRKVRRMMTFQYLLINKNTGLACFANAGHCYPLQVNHKDGTTSYLEQISVPLGIVRKARYENCEFAIAPDSSLILFTDGIVEAMNDQGILFGYDGLARTAAACYSEDPHTYYLKIHNAYINWSREISDDLTMIVINHSGDKHA